MGKKRRVWWIGSALVTAVALFATVAHFVEYNSTDARIERAVARIVDEYGFEFLAQLPGWDANNRRVESKGYSRAPITAETTVEILSILREACPSCKYVHTVYDKDRVPVTTSGGDPWFEVHSFLPDARDGGWTAGVIVYPDNKGFGRPDTEPVATLGLSTFDRPSLWQRIKGLWPW